MTPSSKATLDASTSATDNTGARKFTVSGLDSSKTYNIALLNASDVHTDANNQVTFSDANSNNEADGTDGSGAPSHAVIEVVNGVGAGGTEQDGISPTADGNISFSIDSQNYDDVVPVVWMDDSSDAAFTAGALDLAKPASANSDPKAPVESFGLGGETVWTPGQAADGAITTAKVISVNGDSALINDSVKGYETVNFDSGDAYTYGGTNTTSMATFLKALSAGDTINGTYSRDFQSSFDLTTDVPGTPTGVQVQVGNLDNNAASNYDAKVTWSAPDPAQGLIANYTADLYTVNSNGDLSATPVDSQSTTGTETNVTFNDLANGKYAVEVYATSKTSTDGSSTDATKFTVQKGNVDTTEPTLDSTTLVNGGASAANIDSGDTITLQFDEGMKVAANSAFRFTDPDGEVFQITNGGNSAWTVANYTPSAAGSSQIDNGQITIVLSGDPVKVGGAASSNTGAQVPGTITAFSSTVTDLSGNAVDLTDSKDKTIDTPLG